jgi:cysteine-rich repeat protein
LVSYLEQCDDSNVTSGDGCDAACVIEPGFTCDLGTACREVVCGDSLQDVYAVGDGIFEYEACDDGNATSGDGCDAACDLEIGFVCPGPGVSCREVVCGDGFQDIYFVPGDGGTGGSGGSGGAATGGVATGGVAGKGGSAGSGGGSGTWVFETCDDGNVSSGDGCSASCDVEDGFICDRPGEPCREPRCGDGFVDFIPGNGGTGGTGGSGSGGTGKGGSAGSSGGGTYEECDDGNATGSDGCGASCTLEPGFACPEPGAPCRTIVCGDGFADWPDEECDDGNDVPDDGCTDCSFDGSGGVGGTGSGGTGVTGGFAGTGNAGAGGG